MELEKKNEVPVFDELEKQVEAKAEVHEPEIEAADQMSLFNGGWSLEEETVLNELKKIDVLNLTPLEAMNTLNQLKNQLQKEQ